MRLACVQADVVFNDPTANSLFVADKLAELKGQGVDLAIFPEAFLTGYCVGDEASARGIAIEASANIDHEFVNMATPLEAIRDACDRLDIGCVVGFAGYDEEGLYNGAALFEPGKTPRRYLKVHLPYLGYDRFVREGRDLPVFETRWGKIGVLICFDLRPPEGARVLALKGADLIVLPTNWPVGAEVSANFITIARAVENRVFFATCDRVGTENGVKFIGLSKIVDIAGKVLASAGDQAETLVADVDLPRAREKRIVNVPGEYEMEVLKSRVPELYDAVTAPIH